MTLREQAAEHRERLLAQLAADVDVRRLPASLIELSDELQIEASAALLLLLTGIEFEEARARRHWEAIVDDLQELRVALRREVDVRTAVLDYFVNIHPRLEMPVLVAADRDLPKEPGAATAVPGPITVGAVGFRESLDYELRRARRYQGRVGLILADLDDFARVDRALGREAADGLLDAVGRSVCGMARAFDCVARPGEDEFAVLLPGADREETAARAAALHAAVAEANLDAETLLLKTSVGFAVFPDDGLTADRLLERAAQALYEARRAGGDRVVGWHSERRRRLRRDPADGWTARVRVRDRTTFDPVELHDISRDGLAFDSPTPIRVGAELEISLDAPQGSAEVLERLGVVVHLDAITDAPSAREQDSLPYRVGVAFAPPPGGGRVGGPGRDR